LSNESFISYGFFSAIAGVANKLDLTTKLFFPSAMTTPNKLHFAPYSKKELTEILDSKIEMVSGFNLEDLEFGELKLLIILLDQGGRRSRVPPSGSGSLRWPDCEQKW
jgi:Cdc6-like AAA superfamily ATPase